MMTNYHQKILTRNRLFLVRGIRISENLLSALREDNILTVDMVEEIQSKAVSSERNGKLLDILVKRGPKAFDKLIKALVETDQEGIARSVDPAATEGYITVRDERRKNNGEEPETNPVFMTSAGGRNTVDMTTVEMYKQMVQTLLLQQQSHLLQQQQPLQQQPQLQQPQKQNICQPQERAEDTETRQVSDIISLHTQVQDEGMDSTETLYKHTGGVNKAVQESINHEGQAAGGAMQSMSFHDLNLEEDELDNKWPLNSGPSQQPNQADAAIESIVKDFYKSKELDLAIQPVKDTRHFDTDEIYPVRGSRRGRAVIINNKEFDGIIKLIPREGAEIDGKNLTLLFEKLQFEVLYHKDLTAQEIRDCLELERQRPDHLHADMFVLFVLTHGCQGAIHGTDGQQLKIDDITTIFDGQHCPALCYKPKLFFFQACQGDKKSSVSLSTKIYVTDSEIADADVDEERGDEELSMEEDIVREGIERLNINEMAAEADQALMDVHEKADMLISYATVQDYKAWRRTDNGSWFVRCIVFIFSKFAHKDHVSDLLTKVNALLSKLRTEDPKNPEKYRQIAEKRDTLTKKVYFFPGVSYQSVH